MDDLKGKLLDVSMPITRDMTVYKNREEKRPQLEVLSNPRTGVTESVLHLYLHTGTHVDVPLHMIPGGDDIAGYNLNDMVTPCKVLDFTGIQEMVTITELKEKEIEKDDFILLKTGNSFRSIHNNIFNYDFVYLEKSGAEYLVRQGIKGVGIDSLGIERNQPGHPTHKILFNNKVIIMEGLLLKDVKEGLYTMFAAPLKIPGAEASPVRVLLSPRII